MKTKTMVKPSWCLLLAACGTSSLPIYVGDTVLQAPVEAVLAELPEGTVRYAQDGIPLYIAAEALKEEGVRRADDIALTGSFNGREIWIADLAAPNRLTSARDYKATLSEHDLPYVIAHELGHALGLQHGEGIMNPGLPGVIKSCGERSAGRCLTDALGVP